ncbi:MAG TPA: sensor domain-containing diguanylate cyclase [Myxococcales bacterium]|nr:sensor domain-containing diguanylate cyclase [Myxococcales bacterium]
MEAKDLLRELKRTVDELAAFNEIGKTLTSTLDIREVMRIIMQKVSELLKPQNWSLLLVDEKKNELYFEIAVGEGAEKIKGLRIQLGEGIAGWVAREGVPVTVTDVRQDPRFSARFDEVAHFNTRAVLAVPLRCKGRTLGVIEVINGFSAQDFSEDDVRTLASIADYAAIALENARNFQRIEELTVVDDHTGLFNSRYLYRQLEVETVRARRFGHPLSIVFLDLDHFKTVNDTYGHQLGSQLLREVGSVLLSTLRAIDVATRYGGDEFVVLLPETDRAQAKLAAERLRQAMGERYFLKDHGLAVRITASFGVATFPDDASSADELMRKADMAMYQVKESGRDGVRLVSESRSEAAQA